jgi:hypothetical protein
MAYDRVNSYEGGVGKVIAQGMRLQVSAAVTTLGTIRQLAGGREIVYAKVGAAAISAAHVMAGPLPVANHCNCAPAATASVGAKRFTVTLGATAAAKDLYKDGFVVVQSGTGLGYSYMIDYHLSCAASGNLVLNLKDELETTLLTTTDVALVKNKYNGVVAATAGATTPVGVSLCTASANYFVWLGKRGPWPVHVGSSAITPGDKLTIGSAAGTVLPVPTTTVSSAVGSGVYPVVGVAVMSASGNTDTRAMVDFNL